MKHSLLIAAGCLAATLVVPSTLAFAYEADKLVIARADDPVREMRHGRDDGAMHKRQATDNPAGDVRRSRGRDDGVGHKRRGADDPPGDDRGGRRRDDPPGHA